MLQFAGILLVAILMFPALLRASAGTDIFPILTINPSARSAGLGGEDGLLTSQLSLNNAANLPWLASSELSFQYLAFLSETNYNLISYSKHINDSSGFALSVGYIGVNGLDKTAADSTAKDGYIQSGSFLFSDLIGGLSYGHKIGYDVSAGVGVKFINETIDSYNSSGVMFSFSALYMPSGTPWQIGFGAYNVGSQVAGYNLPSVGYFSLGKHLSTDLFWIGEVDKRFEQGLEIKSGFEYQITDMITLRAGYRNPENDPGLGNFMDYNLTAGFGLRFKKLSLDYAWVPYGDLGAAHRLTMDFKFAGTSEKREPAKYKIKPVVIKENVRNLSMAISYFTGKGMSDAELVVISDYLRTEISNTGAFSVVSRHDMEEQFAEKDIPVPQCIDENCAVVLGKILATDRVVIGKVSKMLGSYRVSVTMVNVETGETIKSLAQDVADFGSIREACWMLAQRLSEFNK